MLFRNYRLIGTKHRVLPEANELVIDEGEDGYTFRTISGQTYTDVLSNLGNTRF